MKKLLILFSIGAVLFVCQPAFGQAKLKTYRNARYGFSIVYPSDLLLARGEADNGDGQVFSNDRAEVRVFGTNLLLGKTMRGEYERLLKIDDTVTYKVFHPNGFVVSGTRDGRVYYQLTRRRKDRRFVTLYTEYPVEERYEYDLISGNIVISFK